MDSASMEPPPLAVYSSLDELLVGANNHAVAHGYKLVVVRSKTNAQGHKTWVHLACDRHGVKRNTHNLTPETRKKNRKSRRCECPMHCIANKTAADLWELGARVSEHNHGPYEPPAPKKKADLPKPHASEVVNLPALQTPSNCVADFCLIPIGTASPSVANEVAEIQRLIKRTGLKSHMHSAGTTLEGSWDDVTRFIGQAHSLLHGTGIVRIHTHISIGSRTDKKQGFEDKVAAVQAILDGRERPAEAAASTAVNGDDGDGDADADADADDADPSVLHDVDAAMAEASVSTVGADNIQPGLDSHRILPQQLSMGHLHPQLMGSHGSHGSQHNQHAHSMGSPHHNAPLPHGGLRGQHLMQGHHLGQQQHHAQHHPQQHHPQHSQHAGLPHGLAHGHHAGVGHHVGQGHHLPQHSQHNQHSQHGQHPHSQPHPLSSVSTLNMQ